MLAAFIAFYPASGAFVSLTQAEIMDAWPDRQAPLMARWDLAGSAGALAGPLLLTAVLAAGGGWRAGFLALAVISGLSWLGALLRRPAARGRGGGRRGRRGGRRLGRGGHGPNGRGKPSWRCEAGGRCAGCCLIEVANLLVDVFTGFLALYLVDVVHLAPAVAALAIAVRLGAALAGDAALVVLLERVGDLTVLRVSAAAAAVLYPGFLLVPGVVPKLAALAVLSAATATWYPVLQARLYRGLPGRSSVAVTLSSAAGLAGGLGPLAVGLAAQGLGLSRALAGLALVPVAVLLVPGRE